MKLLYLCQRVPFPPNRGDRILCFNQIRYLQRHHNVFVGCLAHGDGNDSTGLKDELKIEFIAPKQSWRTKAFGMLLSLLNGEPLTLGYFRNKVLRKKIRNLLQNEKFDAVIVFSSSMAQYVEHSTNVPRIMHFSDVDSQKWHDLANSRSGFRRWMYSREGRLLLTYEKKIASQFDISCFVTPHESELFRRLVPNASAQVLENGVDVSYFSEIPRRPDIRTVAFLGVMDYPPNVESVIYFSRNIWPRILSVYPDAHFLVVGSRPTREVKQLDTLTGITVTGHVPDVRDYLSRATLLVAPLKVARGIQNKILEAMAAELPVLTTPVVAKGLPQDATQFLFIADREPAQFTSMLLQLLADNPDREAKASAAKAYVQQHCTWESKLSLLDHLLAEVTQKNHKKPAGISTYLF